MPSSAMCEGSGKPPHHYIGVGFLHDRLMYACSKCYGRYTLVQSGMIRKHDTKTWNKIEGKKEKP